MLYFSGQIADVQQFTYCYGFVHTNAKNAKNLGFCNNENGNF